MSRNGGVRPRWTKEGRELVYLRGENMVAVPFDPGTGALGPEEILFENPFLGVLFDVTPDGERFLIPGAPRDGPPPRLRVVTNFLEETLAKLEAAGG